MANRRAIVKRRKSVRNIKKITRTMQLIATARFQAAMSRAMASRPYVDKLAELVGELAGAAGEYRHPLLEQPDSDRSLLLVLSSNRGLAGGYNAHLLRAAMDHTDMLAANGVETDTWMVGKKGISAYRFRGREIAERHTHFDDKPRFEQVEPLAREAMHRFTTGEVGSVYVAYMRFFSAGQQKPEVARLLPLATDVAAAGEASPSTYEIRPSAPVVLDRLLPATVRMRLYQAFLDAAVSEQIFRMTAMKAATEAADDMIKNLTRQYNRARQTAITLELLDIVGGANALSG
ncbi:MAG TPA: ATP synthase F1 subunit gamma [Thermoanaerobaculia bacterium]|nr:ATP synthase F1 subunit gamma [Thermoanaerobaculia bacterium]